MPRWLIAILAGHLAFASAGCSWLRSEKITRVVQVVETTQDTARATITQAAIAFKAAVEVLPNKQRVDAEKAFDQALLAYTQADQALTSLRRAVVEAQADPADVARVVAELVRAVRTVITLVDGLSGGAGDPALVGASGTPPPPALVSAYAGLRELERP